MTLIFNDEFIGSGKPDPAKWGYDIGGHGWGNQESQYYTDELENAYVQNGLLHIKAFKKDGRYTSARLVTHDRFSFQYGRVEISARIPRGLGSWPAIWMLPDSIRKGSPWPLCGEIDIMEHVGHNENSIHYSLHTEAYNHKIDTQRTYFEMMPHVCDVFHTYVCEWDAEAISFYFDGQKKACFRKQEEGLDTSEKGWPFDQKFFLLLNVAVGGFWGGPIDDAALPFIMEVEYVRVYQ